MTIIDDIQNFVKQMEGFDNSPIIVKYSRSTNTYCFMQRSKIVYSSLIKYLTLPINKEYMILSYGDYSSLLDKLSTIVSKVILEQDGNLLFSPRKYGFDVYEKGQVNSSYYSGPKKLTEIRFFTVKNNLLVKFFLNFYSSELKSFYKFIKTNEIKG